MSSTAVPLPRRDRVSIGLRAALYDAVSAWADRERRPLSWQVAKVLLDALVAAKQMTQEQADQIWRDTTRRGDD